MKPAIAVAVLFAVGLVATAFGQQLTPVAAAAASEFPAWAIALVVVALIAGGVFLYLKKENPAELATVQAAIQGFVGKLEASAQSIASSLDKNTAATAANTKAVPLAALPAGATPGKVGVAGVITLAVTGDPKADTAAFNAAYFGS